MVKINSENLPAWYQRLCSVLDVVGVHPFSPIAGSFALWLWQVHTTGKAPSWKPSDVDIWFASEREMLRAVANTFSVIQEIHSGALFKRRGPCIVEIHIDDELPVIQFIHRNTYGQKRKAPYCFLDMFDLSVAQVAVEYFERDSVRFAFGDDDVRNDIHNKTTRCFRDLTASDLSKTNTPTRLEKYKARGFEAIQGEIRELVKWGQNYDDPKWEAN